MESREVDAASIENITPDQLDEDTVQKLRGDAIGGTLYSEVFVLKTLLKFSDFKWDEEFENDLCLLWDMAIDEEICKYLLDSEFMALAHDALTKYSEPRFVEIVVGIVVNLLCSKHAPVLSEELVHFFVELMNFDYPMISIQVMRFIHAVSYKSTSQLLFITDSVMEQIIFILVFSLNKELVAHTLKTLACITSDHKLDATIIKAEMLQGAVCGYKLLKSEEPDDYPSKNLLMYSKHVIEIACNVSSYVEGCSNTHLLNALKMCLDNFFTEISQLLSCFSLEENLLPVPDELFYFMEGLLYVCKMLNAPYHEKLFVKLCEVMFHISEWCDQERKKFVELFCYFLAESDPVTIRKDLLCLDNVKVHKLLQDVYKSEFSFDFEYLHVLDKLVDS